MTTRVIAALNWLCFGILIGLIFGWLHELGVLAALFDEDFAQLTHHLVHGEAPAQQSPAVHTQGEEESA